VPAVIFLKSPEEIEIIRAANQIVAEVHAELKEAVLPGVTTADLDAIAEEGARKRGAKPAFKGYAVGRNVFPASLCSSINEQVVHGIPSTKCVLKDGDIIGLDYGVVYRGYYGDAAITHAVGEVPRSTRRLMEVTEKALHAGIEAARVGNRIGDVSAGVQATAEGAGFSVVREFVGHGVGRKLHEEPQVPNFGTPNRGIPLQEGMVLAIEPMVNAGGREVYVMEDGWTAVTADGSLSAHFEHSIAVTKNGPYILSQL
jgi:methionyl aminopeptidase